MMSKLLLFGLCTLTLACRSKAIEIDGEEQSLLPDNDFDGYNSDVDCDDFDYSVNPGAFEACDGIDNNCDGVVDENVRSKYYEDVDGDGFGNQDSYIEACSLPDGYVPLGNDCDDSNPDVFTGAVEICNELDDDCDGDVDEDLVVGLYFDADGDGYGDPNLPSSDCTRSEGYVFYGDDCDDTNPDIHPNHPETCDEIDNDCDGIVDNGSTYTFYEDIDQDGYGDSSSTIQACTAPNGYVSEDGDCNDIDPMQYPNAEEYCNQADDDCDGDIDEDPVDPPIWYYDIDGDGFGSNFITAYVCSAPTGYISDNTDCDDTNPSVYPGATEICNNLDDDCSGQIDDNAVDASTWYADYDRDNFGNASDVLLQCNQPFDFILVSGDCDDGNDAAYPNADELCNGVDEDCDGVVDNNTIDSLIYFQDSDGDGFGDAAQTLEECQPPVGYVLDDTDCDDTDGTIFPDAQEDCDGIDQNCNGNSFYEQDINGNGLYACEESVWFRNDSANPTNPTGSSSQAAAYLTNAGMTINQYYHGSNSVTNSLLQNYGLYVHHGKNNGGTSRAYTNAEAGALENWVYNGGRLLYIGHRTVTNCDIADSFPSPFGFSCSPGNNSWQGSTTTFQTHPISLGLSEVGGHGGEFWSVQSPAFEIADINGNLFLAATEYGEGKVVYVANHFPFINSGNGYRINFADNELMVENIWNWLLE